MQLYHVVAALIADASGICLVQQQGPRDAVPTWALPGGGVEDGETLPDTLAREVLEETGLRVEEVGQLLYVVQHHDASANALGTAHVLRVARWGGSLRPCDPDRLILRAEFLPLPEAMVRLRTAPSRTMWEPMVAYLRGEAAPGAVWCYRSDSHGSERLVAKVAKVGSPFS